MYSSGEDQDFVKVDKHVPVQHVSEHVVNQGLQDGTAVGHHLALVMTPQHIECGLPLIPFFDPGEVIGIAEAELGEKGVSLK